jgi:hypothetical protein
MQLLWARATAVRSPHVMVISHSMKLFRSELASGHPSRTAGAGRRPAATSGENQAKHKSSPPRSRVLVDKVAMQELPRASTRSAALTRGAVARSAAPELDTGGRLRGICDTLVRSPLMSRSDSRPRSWVRPFRFACDPVHDAQD